MLACVATHDVTRGQDFQGSGVRRATDARFGPSNTFAFNGFWLLFTMNLRRYYAHVAPWCALRLRAMSLRTVPCTLHLRRIVANENKEKSVL